MKSIILVAIYLMGGFAFADSTCTQQTDITGVIGPATVDLVKRVQASAKAESCDSILLTINTPGGSLESTRQLVEMILNSQLPYLCLVSPSGGHAGSAGAIILQACHVNGALHGTNLGAATPILMSGEMPKDLRQKILNDTKSWMQSLTRLRGRSEKFGEDIIVEAKAVTAEDALKLKAIDFTGVSVDEFLKFGSDRKVKMDGGREVTVKTGAIKIFEHDTRFRLLELVADPQFAYLLFMGSLAMIYFEFTHPGAIAPGVLGGIGLIVALIAMDKLDVEWAGLLLILLGIAMFVAEMFLPTLGLLGIGGVAAFVIGSIFLFDPAKTGGYTLPLSLILPVAILLSAVMLGLGILAARTRGVKKRGGYDELVGHTARVTQAAGQHGYIEIMGEKWKYESAVALQENDSVKVTGYNGLVLQVQKES